jgi:hypothetical protein
MISNQLQATFKILETLAFEKWKVASPKQREKICADLGKWEGEQIIKEIKAYCAELAKANGQKRVY